MSLIISAGANDYVCIRLYSKIPLYVHDYIYSVTLSRKPKLQVFEINIVYNFASLSWVGCLAMKYSVVYLNTRRSDPDFCDGQRNCV